MREKQGVSPYNDGNFHPPQGCATRRDDFTLLLLLQCYWSELVARLRRCWAKPGDARISACLAGWPPVSAQVALCFASVANLATEERQGLLPPA